MIRKSELKRVGFKPAPTKEPKPEPGPRKKRCKVCRAAFLPDPPWHAHCSPDCGAALALTLLAKRKAKDQRKERAADKVKLMRKADYAAATQRAVNRYVNIRDHEKPCVSCGKPAASGGVRNASHFKSVGSNSALRFNLWNIHSSCYRCNVELSGNLGEYYPRLIERIGAKKVEFLQFSPRERRYEVDYLQRMQKIFTKKAKRLKERYAHA